MKISDISKYGTAINAGVEVAANGYDVATGKKTVLEASGSLAKFAVSTVASRAATLGATALVGGTIIPFAVGAATYFAIDSLIDTITED